MVQVGRHEACRKTGRKGEYLETLNGMGHHVLKLADGSDASKLWDSTLRMCMMALEGHIVVKCGVQFK